MNPGELIDGRFEVIESAGAGGMAEVFRARDRTNGNTIALKVLSAQAPTMILRFEREVRVLAELDDPCIVHYLAHGRTAAGESYLAMEWLDGEDLARRLKRGPLGVEDTVALGLRIASGLAAAHDRGIIHRDLKPANLFLVDRELSRTRLIDFGIARSEYELIELTETGVLVGTPVYMSPEQALGSKCIDTRADLYALGCVLFRCLAGRPPFVGENAIVLLGRIVLETAPPLRTLRADVPAALAELIADLLNKSPDARPATARDVAHRLQGLAGTKPASRPHAVLPSVAGETRVSIVVVERAKLGGSARATAYADEPTELLARSTERAETPGTRGTTLPQHGRGDVVDTLLAARVAPYTSIIRRIADGSILAVVIEPMPGLDAGTRAARTAFVLREMVPDSHMVIVSKRATGDGLVEVGGLLDRAVEWLRRPARRVESDAVNGTPVRPIRIDAHTAGLLDRRFDVAADRDGLLLRGELPAAIAFPFLGRPVAIVGRDRECSRLLDAMSAIASGAGPEAWLVRGPAGSGRRRVVHEALDRFSALDRAHDTWFAAVDPLARNAVYSTLAALIASAAGLASDASGAATRGATLGARLSRSLDADDAVRVHAALAPLVDAAVPPGGSELPPWHPAAALSVWVRASAAQCPLVIVLENVGDVDAASLDVLDEAIASASPLRILVIATCTTAEPGLLPRLLANGRLRELPIDALPADARASWASAVSDRGLDGGEVQRAFTSAGELPLAIEESLRNIAATVRFGEADSIPSLVRARLTSVPRPALAVLGCIAVCGAATGATVCAVMEGARMQPAEALRHIEWLVAREWIEVDDTGRQGDRRGLRVSHPLARSTVYEAITSDQRAAFHRGYATALEAARFAPAFVVAAHFERGGALDRALPHFSAAARAAFDAADPGALIASAEAALRCAPHDRERAALERLRGDALLALGQHAAAEASLRVALECLERASIADEWPLAASALALALSRTGRVDEAARLAARAVETASTARDPAAECVARTRFAKILAIQSRYEDAENEARRAVTRNARPRYLVEAVATLAFVRLLAGRSADALMSAREAAAMLGPRETAGSEALVRLVLAESLHAAGLLDAARATAALACANIDARAGTLRDPALRASYLEQVPEHARLRWCHARYAVG